MVRKVRGVECTQHGPGCHHRDCRQPESLGRALDVLEIPYRRILDSRRWADTLKALRNDQLVACEIALEGSSHAVLLSSASLASFQGAAWIGVDDPLPLRAERKIARLYQGGFRPTFLAAVGR